MRNPRPAGEPLRLVLDRTPRRGPIMLLSSLDRPWTSDGFRTSWAKACAKANISGLTFHDLRGSAVVRLAIADATVPQIATITGHSLKDVEAILDTNYLGRDVQLAEMAEARTANKAVKRIARSTSVSATQIAEATDFAAGW